MKNFTRGYRALLRQLAVLSGAATLMLVPNAPVGQVSALANHASASTVIQATSPSPAASPSPSPSPHKNTTVTNPVPPGPGAPHAGLKPSTGPSRLTRALVAAGLAAPSNSLTTNTGTLVGTTRSFDLYATTGTIIVPGTPTNTLLPIWGFSTSLVPGTGSIPGPILEANAGETLNITLHNGLPNTAAIANAISLELPASGAAADISGTAVGSAKAYAYGPLNPGTYLYEAGATPFGARQVRMGLAGLLVVRPANFAACNCAYGNVPDQFVDEATGTLNAFDPEFNGNPFGADPIEFNPSIFTVNGFAYDPANPTLGKINVAPGDVLLIRYANLSDHERGIAIANERQSILADDSFVLANPADVSTKWLNPGQVSDSFVLVDPSLPLNTHLPLYDAGFHFNNEDHLGLGGAFTYLDVVQGLAGAPAGPVTTVNVNPPTNSGIEDTTVSGTMTPSAGAALQNAEWFLDDPGIAGTAPAAQHFAPSANYNFVIPSATLNAMLMSSVNRDGDHIIWVHAMDSSGLGTWGVVSGDVFTYNATGPVVAQLSVHVSPTNGKRPTDVANGAGPVDPASQLPSNVPTNDLVVLGTIGASLSNFLTTAAEFCIDTTSTSSNLGNCANPTPIVLTPSGSDGTNQIDAYGNVLNTPTACVPIPLPPGPIPPSGPPPAPGGGSVVSFCGVVTAAVLATLSEGAHTLHIRACEQLANSTRGCGQQPTPRWGAYNADSAIQFNIDFTGPNATAISVDPNPNNGHLISQGNLNFLDSLQLSSTLVDPLSGSPAVKSNIAYAEVFVTCSPLTPLPAGAKACASVAGPIDPVTNAVPPDGTGAEMVPSGGAWDSPTKLAYAYIPLAVLTEYPEGHVRLWVHSQDQAGNFGPYSSVELIYDKTAPLIDTPAEGTQVACQAGCTINFTAHDPVSGGVNSNIVQAEWFLGQGVHLVCETGENTPPCELEVAVAQDPGFGLGNPITLPVPLTTSTAASFTLPPQPVGTNIVFRVRDAAGNWSELDQIVTT